jgi:hypothetical protein
MRPPRRGRVRLAIINVLVSIAWRLWDAADVLRGGRS